MKTNTTTQTLTEPEAAEEAYKAAEKRLAKAKGNKKYLKAVHP